MKTWDKIVIAFRSIINNKSRSILTVIIIFIVSSLITAIMMIAINFARNSYTISEESIRISSSSIYLYRSSDRGDRNSRDIYYSKEEMLEVVESINGNQILISDLNIDNYQESSYFVPKNNRKITVTEHKQGNYYSNWISTKLTSFYIPFGVNEAVIDGSIWTEDDVNTNNIWVTDRFINNSFKEGLILNVGSKVWINTFSEYYDRVGDYFYSTEYVIKGIISTEKVKEHNDLMRKLHPTSYRFKDTGIDIYRDISYLANNSETVLSFNSFSFDFLPPLSSYDFNELYEQLEIFVGELSTTTKTEKPIISSIYSTIIEEFKMIRIVNAFIIGLAIALGVFVLLLSIGSVANTIIISVDKNKKFIGLTKALGLKQKAVVDIVRFEATMTIIFGVLLSTIGVLVAMPLFRNVNEALINSAFAYQFETLEYNIITVLPFYLPLGVTVIFVLMTLLFSRGSLNAISKMDVITIISEVS